MVKNHYMTKRGAEIEQAILAVLQRRPLTAPQLLVTLEGQASQRGIRMALLRLSAKGLVGCRLSHEDDGRFPMRTWSLVQTQESAVS